MKTLKNNLTAIDLGFGKIYLDEQAWEHYTSGQTYIKYKNGIKDKVVHQFEFERALTDDEKNYY